MLERFATRLAVKLLKRSDLSLENRNLLTVCLLDKLGALPFTDIIQVRDGETFVNDVPLDVEKARQLIEGAKTALNNNALKLVWQAIAFRAVNIGVHNAESERQMLFMRAALWTSQQEQDLLREWAGGDI